MDGRSPWSDLLNKFFENPTLFFQRHIIWVLVIVVLLFILSRLNNTLEITGVNRAIYISRAIVSSLTAFVIAPIIFILFVNMFAWWGGYEYLNLTNLFKWLYLSGTSIVWVTKSAVLRGIVGHTSEEMYSTSSIIRIGAVALPLIFVWFRIASSNFWRLLLIPMIIGIFLITSYQRSEPTFLDPVLEKYKTKIDSTREEGGRFFEEDEINANNQYFFIGLMALIGLGILASFFIKNKFIPLLLVLGFLILFFSLTRDNYTLDPKKTDPLDIKDHPIEVVHHSDKLDDMIRDFDRKYLRTNPEDFDEELSALSDRISRQIVVIDSVPVPAKICRKYPKYFLDLCD